MPGSKVLTMASNITCGHAGSVLTNSSARLKINGDSVLLKSGIEGGLVSDCSTVETPQGQFPCESVAAGVVGEARKLKVNTKAVMLETLQGTTIGNPQGALHADANQERLTTI